MLKDFKTFILRGNVLDLAVAVVIGGAFTKIVDSLVKDVLMPPLGLVLARINFTELFISLNGQTYATLKAAQDAGAPTVNYGLFIQSVIGFIIVAFVIFLAVRMFTKMRPVEPAPPTPPATKECPFCISTIALRASRCPQCASALQ